MANLMRVVFAPRFSRADFYGFAAFMVAIYNGYSPLVLLPAIFAWAMFSTVMEDRVERRDV